MGFKHNLKDIRVFRMAHMANNLWFKLIKEWANLCMELILKET